MARQGQLITASFPKQSCGSSALVARGAKGSPPRTGHKMGTQNQAIDKSKDEMATKRLVVLPRGERPRCCANRNVAGSFNSRSREGSDSAGTADIVRAHGFNSRSREGSDSQSRRHSRSIFGFQFALPRGERPSATTSRATVASFNSRSRVGSDADHIGLRIAADVSIRAPAWGATAITG